MNTTLQSILEGRVSTGHFDPQFTIASTEVKEMVRLATQAPSAFNLQNWHFVAAKTETIKSQLQEAAYGQRQISEASVTFVIFGLTNYYEKLHQNLQPSVDAGIIPASLQKTWSDMATASHQHNPRLQRDEAIRSASLAAMSLIVAAREMGFQSGAVGGFDPGAVRNIFGLPDSYVPVILIPVGKGTDYNWAQKIRRPIGDVLQIL